MKDRLINPQVEIRKSMLSGYGVFARKDFKKGELIEECPVLVLNEMTSSLEKYSFLPRNQDRFFLPLGYGCLYNHASLPNAAWEYDEKNRLMTFTALNDLKKGDEIFIYYSLTWFTTRKMEAKRPAPLWQRYFSFLVRAALVIGAFIILKMALLPGKPTQAVTTKIQLATQSVKQ